mmetsp:Transcript_34676/g.68896  ORF Transcript_34676/g.68896 Transcript_34676/m.68896 type:complete len:253 (+) Transcript_34676:115-873(+)
MRVCLPDSLFTDSHLLCAHHSKFINKVVLRKVVAALKGSTCGICDLQCTVFYSGVADSPWKGTSALYRVPTDSDRRLGRRGHGTNNISTSKGRLVFVDNSVVSLMQISASFQLRLLPGSRVLKRAFYSLVSFVIHITDVLVFTSGLLVHVLSERPENVSFSSAPFTVHHQSKRFRCDTPTARRCYSCVVVISQSPQQALLLVVQRGYVNWIFSRGWNYDPILRHFFYPIITEVLDSALVLCQDVVPVCLAYG